MSRQPFPQVLPSPQEQTSKGFQLQSSLHRPGGKKKNPWPLQILQHHPQLCRSPSTKTGDAATCTAGGHLTHCKMLSLKLSPNYSSLELGFFHIALWKEHLVGFFLPTSKAIYRSCAVGMGSVKEQPQVGWKNPKTNKKRECLDCLNGRF